MWNSLGIPIVLAGNLLAFPPSTLVGWSMVGCAQNWTVEEKEFLFELVSTQINVVEDKRSDNNAHKKKKAAWKHIYEQFEVRYEGTGRDVVRLNEQWKQMKATAKKEVSDFKRAQKKTGGGKAEVEADITSREDDNACETNEIVTQPTTSYDSAESDNIAQEPTNRQVLHTLLKFKRKLWGH